MSSPSLAVLHLTTYLPRPDRASSSGAPCSFLSTTWSSCLASGASLSGRRPRRSASPTMPSRPIEPPLRWAVCVHTTPPSLALASASDWWWWQKERKKENRQPKGGIGGRHAATTQGFLTKCEYEFLKLLDASLCSKGRLYSRGPSRCLGWSCSAAPSRSSAETTRLRCHGGPPCGPASWIEARPEPLVAVSQPLRRRPRQPLPAHEAAPRAPSSARTTAAPRARCAPDRCRRGAWIST